MPPLSLRLFVAIGIVAAPGAASALVTTYVDETAFLAAAGSVTTETFDGFVSDASFYNTSLDVGDFVIAATTSSVPTNFNEIDASPYEFVNLGSPYAKIGIDDGDTVTLTFDAPITAFGALFYGVNDDELRSQITVAGETVAHPVTSGSVFAYFGLISDTPFSVLTFTGLSDGGEAMAFDDATYSAISAPVPVPAAAPLLAGALGGLGLLARRRRRG
ncbi:MAG: VPLPA-CTERM sorting domain-containing protein [Pseudomonadota bacterium]|nr:VPLPA-CTERM sorting domain-containing protein [Pseudomonadota bacterium]MEE3099514.1 VPLPA-CTERM sorting domain-containing protein [Pseudomonadota bacterium]